MIISEINIYPIKSLRGISLRSAKVEERGLENDRRWMLVDEDGKFITQRDFPQMARVAVNVVDGGLEVEYEARRLLVPVIGTFPAETRRRGEKGDVQTRKVTVWRSRVEAAVYDGEVTEFFSEVLGSACRLVTMTDAKRPVNYWYRVHKNDHVSFADGYPFLLIGEGSLADLNRRLRQQTGDASSFRPLPMNRFRPNFVVKDSEPFAEDTWKRIRIGSTVFHVVKPCGRCVVTTIDQASGVKTGSEPLKTLATFRSRRNKVLFGQNLIADDPGGIVRVGDHVEVLEYK
jgi:uncharacterized protein